MTQTALLPTKVQMKAQLPPKRVTASAQRWPRVRVSGACMREASHDARSESSGAAIGDAGLGSGLPDTGCAVRIAKSAGNTLG